jgi:hypothetical protein
MGAFEYLLMFVAVILGVAVSDLVISLHRLLSAGSRVRWDLLAPLAAAVAFLKILTQWWSWFGTAQIARGLTFEMFLGIVSATVMMFLLAAAALPDEAPDDAAIDLAAHYERVRRRFWLLFSAETLLMISVDIWAQIAIAHARLDPRSLLQPVIVLIPIAAALAFVKNRWVQGAALVALIGLYLLNSIGRPLAG